MSAKKPTIDVDALIAQVRASLPPAPGANAPVEAAPLSVEEILRRVRHEIAQRRGISALGDDDAPEANAQRHASLPRWRPAAEPVPTRDEYVLGDFLALDDADFVEEAYRCVLRRPADEAGFRHHLRALRQGRMSKVEVLAALRWSPEGEARSVHIDGLLLPTLLHRWQRRRFIGPVVTWLHAYLRLPSVLWRHQRDHLALAREAHEMGRHVNVLAGQASQSLARLDDGVAALMVRLDQIEAGISRSNVGQEQLAQRLAGTESTMQSLASGADLARLQAGVVALQARTLSSEESLDGLRDELAGQSRRGGEMARALEQLAESIAALQAIAVDQASESLDRDALYARFEDRFRGSEELVRTRVSQYLPMVQALGADPQVVDLGSGRGEWLQLMGENGIRCIGVDTNEVFIAHCRERGLEVRHEDAIAWLKAQPSASVSAITSLHLVEHLPFDALMQLIEQACRVIVPGGMLLLETPNPENLLVSTFGFYMDPTHRNPLPPQMLAWLVEASGFEAIQVERLTLARELDVPALLGPEVAGSEAMNVLLAKLQAAPDYAIVARRP